MNIPQLFGKSILRGDSHNLTLEMYFICVSVMCLQVSFDRTLTCVFSRPKLM